MQSDKMHIYKDRNYEEYKTKMKHFFNAVIPHKGHFTQFIPLVAILLIVSIIACYDVFLHEYVIRKRWCDDDSFCFWSLLHLIIIHYLGFMILWNYLKTVFASPGVVLTTSDKEKKVDNPFTWKSTQARGGLCYINPRLNIEEEERRVSFILFRSF